MIGLEPERIAAAAGAAIAGRGGPGSPARGLIDSRRTQPGDLFFGLRGERTDGGEHAEQALRAGAWGAVVEAGRAERLVDAGAPGWILASPDPLASLQSLARAWRRELGCRVVGITGSTGKTSVKDICRAILPFDLHASPENLNTEIGLPLAILAAPAGSELLVLEMAMRGPGQIAELCEIAEPDVGAITNVGPVHLELLGSERAVAAAKAEILTGLREGGRAIVPADAPVLAPFLDPALETLRFGPGGEVEVRSARPHGGGLEAVIATPAGEGRFELPFSERHNLLNAACAVAIGVALDAPVAELARRAPGISFSRLRGELVELPGGSVLVNDCYNANPISMRAALEHLASLEVTGRRIAVLGGMGELGPEGPGYHRQAAELALELGIEELVAVGELARDYGAERWTPDPAQAVDLVAGLLGAGDAVLVKGSRSVGLEAFTEGLVGRAGGRG